MKLVQGMITEQALAYSQVPNKWGVLMNKGSEKIRKFIKRGGQNKLGGRNLRKGFE